jgi:hypothetical protein
MSSVTKFSIIPNSAVIIPITSLAGFGVCGTLIGKSYWLLVIRYWLYAAIDTAERIIKTLITDDH